MFLFKRSNTNLTALYLKDTKTWKTKGESVKVRAVCDFQQRMEKRNRRLSLLSNNFKRAESLMEVEVKMLYDVDGSGKIAEKKDRIIQYTIFTNVYNEQIKLYQITRKIILGRIRISKDKNVLKE